MDPAIVESITMSLCFSVPFFTAFGAFGSWLFFRYKVRELEVRSTEAHALVEQTRLLTGAPEWLDPNDPGDLAAWKSARGELAGVLLTRPDSEHEGSS